MIKTALQILCITLLFSACGKRYVDKSEITTVSDNLTIIQLSHYFHQYAIWLETTPLTQFSPVCGDTIIRSNAITGSVLSTNDFSTYPRIVDADFRNNPCAASDGHNSFLRKGKIRIQAQSRIQQNSGALIAQTDSFYVNGYKLDLTSNIVHIGLVAGFPQYNINDVGKITTPDAKVIEFTATYKFNWKGQPSNLNPYDDIFTFTGNIIGKNSVKRPFSTEITSEIEKTPVCLWLNNGVITVKPENLTLRTISFPTNCSNEIKYTQQGKKQTLYLF